MRHLSFLVLGSMLLAPLAACGDDDHASGVPSCDAIIAACHEVNPGTGRAHECHETAHDVGTAAACNPIQAECVMVCEALAGTDGGTTDTDGGTTDTDGGTTDTDGGTTDTDGGTTDTDAGSM